nr:MAG TPA: HNH endonuclease [Caudoviricetes sp.]
MNYQKIYDDLMKKRLENPPTGKFERHHIVPRSLGGSNDKENIVKLTLREHYIAHLLLCRIHRKTQNYYPMLRALNMMKAGREGDYIKNSRMFEYFRADFARVMSESQRGEGNSQYGTTWYYHPELKLSKSFKPDEVPEGFIKGYVISRKKDAVALPDGSGIGVTRNCIDCGHEIITKRDSRSNLCDFCRSIRRCLRDWRIVVEREQKYRELFDEFVKSGLSLYLFAKERGLYNSTLYRNWNRLGLIESNYNFILNTQ